MADDVSVKFGADIKDLQDKFSQVTGMFKVVSEHFAAMAAVVAGGAAFKEFIDTANRLNSTAERMSRTLGITAAEAGAIDMAVNDVAASMGVGGASADTYTGAFLKFNRQLRTNSDALRSMGVDVDGLTSGQKTSNQVFQEALQIVGKYKPGIDQTQIAMQMFGRSVQDVQLLMGVTSEKIEEARKKAASLNLTITQEGVEGARRYRSAMNEVRDVLEGVEKTIGEGVMPHFSDMAEKLASLGPVMIEALKPAVQTLVNVWTTLGETVEVVWDTIKTVAGLFKDVWEQVFGKDGPSAMEIFNNALKIVEIAFVGFRITFELSASLLKTGLTLMGEYMVRFADVADRAMHFDLAGAREAWKSGVAEHNKILDEGMRDAVAIAEKGQADIEKIALRSTAIPAGTEAGAPKGGTQTAKIGKDTGGQDARLAAQLALQRAMQDAAMQLQLEYLKQSGDMYDSAYKHGLLSVQEYYAAKLAIEQRANETQLTARRKELADAQAAEAKAQAKSGEAVKAQDRNKAEAEVVKFRTEQAKLQGQINVLEAQGLDLSRRNANDKADAVQKQTAALQAILDTSTKTTADNEVADERAALDQKKALRQISAQDAFKIEQDLENQSYAAAVANIAARRSLITGSQEEQRQQKAQLDAEAEAAEQQHQLKLTAIDQAAELERKQLSIDAQKSIESGFATLIKDMLSGQKTLGDAIRGFALSIAQTFENLAAKRFAERLFQTTGINKAIDGMVDMLTGGVEKMVGTWLVGEQAKTVATAAGATERTTIETAAAATSKSLTIGEALASIGAKAWQAAAAVYASIAAIPYVGPFLAPAMAIGAGVAVMGFASNLMSAEGGLGSVPFDGAMIQAHKEEMVLPRFLAEGVRNISEPGRLQSMIDQSVSNRVGNAAPAAGGDTHFNISAIDGRSVARFFDEHGDSIVKSLQKQNRNFAFKP